MRQEKVSGKDYKILKGKRVLITGINGFIGSNLAMELKKLKADVYGVSSKIIAKNVLKSDILDISRLDNFVGKNKIQICFHLAGHSLVEEGQSDPYNTFSVNIQGTLNMLELARKNKFEKIIIASSSHVYGKNKVPYYEGFIPRPSRPYETSKACTDLIAQSYADTFNLPVYISRFVNVYGPGDLNFNRIFPKVIRHIYKEEKMLFWGGNVVRDYLYISDAVDAYLKLCTNKNKFRGMNRVFNFGGGNLISVKDLLVKISSHAKKPLKIKKSSIKRQKEIKSQYVSFAKAKKILGWNPSVTLDEGILRSLDWYRMYFSENRNT